MRQEARFGEDELAHPSEVLEGRLAAELCELLPCGSVTELRLVPEREEGLVAAGLGACARHSEHLVPGHVGTLAATWRLRERAVVADVAAELRQRDENLGGVRDDVRHRRARASS
jgi:hypothetical protein